MTPIIETKLIPYQLPANYIDRPGLYRRLSERPEAKLLIISGEGGWGKSLLVASYLKAAQLEAAWVNLDRPDQDPFLFLQYISVSILGLYPEAADSLSMLSQQSGENEHWQPAVSSLINAVLNLTPKTVRLVLDDFHKVSDSEQIREVLKHLLNHAPPNLQIILVGRRRPDISVSRLSIDREVMEFGTDLLAFSQDEMFDFFQKTYQKSLSGHQLNLLSRYTDGWPISLRIFGETTADKSESDIELLLQSLTRANRSVIRYFDEEVFSHLPDDMQAFLMKTSILDRFDSDLCDRILKSDQSRGIIDRILKRDLFLIRLDDQNRWYRYHQPFRRFLSTKLTSGCNEEELSQLHQNAAGYFQDKLDWQNATHHFVMAGDFESASDCIEQVVKGYFGHAYYESISNWLNRIPDAITENRAGLQFVKGWLAVSHGNYVEGEILLVRVLSMAAEQKSRDILGRTVDFLMVIYSIMNLDNEAVRVFGQYEALMEPGSEYHQKCQMRKAISLLKMGRKSDADLYWLKFEMGASDIDSSLLKEIQAAKAIHHLFPIGRINEGLQMMEEGLNHYRHKASLQWQCELVIHLFYANRFLARYDESRKWLDELLDIQKRIKNRHLVEYINCILAEEDLREGNIESARKRVSQFAAVQSLPQLDVLKMLVRAGLALAEDDPDSFRNEAERAIALVEQLGHGWILFHATVETARLYDRCNEARRARQLLVFCLQKMAEIDAWYAQALCNLLLASVELKMENRSSALEYLGESLRICDEKHYSFLLTDIEAEASQKLLLFALLEKQHLSVVKRQMGRMSRSNADSILPLLGHEDPELRLAGVEILADMQYREAEKAFSGLTKDSDKRVRDQVELALAKLIDLPPRPLQVYTLGRFRVIRDDHEITAREWRLKMSSSLFKFLLYQKENSVSFDRFIDIFYRDVREKDARGRLHKAASRLRATLEPGIAPKRESAYLKASDGFYQLNLPEGSWVDTQAFEELFHKGDTEETRGEHRNAIHFYEAALDLYQGEWLEEDLYDDWTQAARTRFSEMRLEILRRVVRLNFQIFEYDLAIESTTKLLDLDNCDENAWFFLMKCHLAKGNRAAAVKAYHACCECLQKELEITPDKPILELFKSIR